MLPYSCVGALRERGRKSKGRDFTLFFDCGAINAGASGLHRLNSPNLRAIS
jgi:hypothetical protein